MSEYASSLPVRVRVYATFMAQRAVCFVVCFHWKLPSVVGAHVDSSGQL